MTYTVIQYAEQARANALDEQLAQEQRRRILAGWAENKAIMADAEKTRRDALAAHWLDDVWERENAEAINTGPALAMVGNRHVREAGEP